MIDLSNIVRDLTELADETEQKGNALLDEAEGLRSVIAGLGGKVAVVSGRRGLKTKTYAQRKAVKSKAKDILKTLPWEAEEGKTIGSLPVKAKPLKTVKRKYVKKAAWWGKAKKAKKGNAKRA